MAKYGTIKDFGVSRSQKPRVLIHEDGQPEAQWYSLGTTKMEGLVKPGDRISFDPNMSNFNGVDIWFVGKYAKEPDKTEAQVNRESGELNKAPNTMTKDECIFVCGVVNNAISSGAIKSHTDISTWVKSAVDAMRHFEDRIPFDPEEP